MRRFGPGVAVLAAVLIGAGAAALALRPIAEREEPRAAGVAAASAVRPAGACEPVPRGTSRSAALLVTKMFVWWAVLRQDPACSFDLVTVEMQKGLTRRQWASGDIPVVAFLTEQPDEVAHKMESWAERDLVGAYLILSAPDAGAQVFKLILVARQGRWLVAHWAPVGPDQAPSDST